MPAVCWTKSEKSSLKLKKPLPRVIASTLREEVGDLLFAVTNLARTLGADPEQCLRTTNSKFERRFRYVERELAADARPLTDASLDEMETHWQAAKAQEKTLTP